MEARGFYITREVTTAGYSGDPCAWRQLLPGFLIR